MFRMNARSNVHQNWQVPGLGWSCPLCEYIQRRENIIAVGNSSTGKTHLALEIWPESGGSRVSGYTWSQQA